MISDIHSYIIRVAYLQQGEKTDASNWVLTVTI